MHDLPDLISKKCAYADDLTILLSTGNNWESLEKSLGQNLETSVLLLGMEIKAQPHLNNREAICYPNVMVNGKSLPFCTESTFLGITLDLGSLNSNK